MRLFRCVRPFSALLSLLFALLLSGCGDGSGGELGLETEEASYLRAKQYLRQDKADKALSAFEKVIDKRSRASGSAPESHLEAGLLYLNHRKDPVMAIYHFRRHLELRPDSENADNVRALEKSAEKAFAEAIPGRSYNSPYERLDLLDHIKMLKHENLSLKRRLAAYRKRLESIEDGAMSVAEARIEDETEDIDFHIPPTQQESETTVVESAGIPTNYVVQRGDSLYKISSRVYGTSRYWKKIQEANQDVLPSPQSLRPGMELRIPANPNE